MAFHQCFAYLFGYVYLLVIREAIGVTDERFLLRSSKLPDDVRLVPAVGNGHIASQVFSDTIYMNGLMNGIGNNSHRARIPSTAAFNISIDNTETAELTLDMYRGIFIKDFDHTDCTIQQRIYAHRAHTRLVVNEFTVTRKLPGVGGDLSINLAENVGADSADLSLTTIAHLQDASHTYGVIREPEMDWSERKSVHIFHTNIPPSVTLPGAEEELTWSYITAISPVQQDALQAFQQATITPAAALLQSHEQAWADLWEAGRIEVNGNITLAQIINACFFHIMISTPDAVDNINPFAGLSPGGLARGGLLNTNFTGGAYNDYAGHVFWDMDTWILPPVLMLHPDKAERYLDARLRVIDVVKEHSANTGFEGVRFPWEQGWTGSETCPWQPATEYQIHVTADVSYALRQYLYSTDNVNFLHEHGAKDMLLEIARFWRSRSVDGERESVNVREIYGVMGPDENHFNINNSVFTNYNAKLSMQMPGYMKEELGVAFSQEEESEINYLDQIANKMLILYDENLEYHPQFDGFDYISESGNEDFTIKQSDVVLLGYPLMMEMPATVRKNDLLVYENLTDNFGPDTGTWSMHTVGWLELGDPDKAEERFFKMFRNINGPFLIFSEKPANTPAEGMRAVNFITGMGGLLQSIFFGYGSIRVRMHQLDLLTPHVLPYSDSWSIRSLDYRGSSLDFTMATNKVTIQLKSQETNADDLYYIKDSDGYRIKMKTGDTLEMAPGKVSLVVESEIDAADLPPEPKTTPQTDLGVINVSSFTCLLITFILSFVCN